MNNRSDSSYGNDNLKQKNLFNDKNANNEQKWTNTFAPIINENN